MSDKINYNELDQAVNAATARRTRAASPVWPQTGAPAQPVTRTVKQAPVAAPASRRRVMDFTPVKRTQSAARPVAARPVVKRVMQSEHSVAAQIQQRQRTAAQAKAATPAPAKSPAPKPVAKPKTTTKPAAKQPAAPKKPAEEPKATPPKDSPDANNYSLGGRSPFFINTNVEKRPLGTNIPETSLRKLHSTRNVYSHKSPTEDKYQASRHIITAAPQKRSGWLWVLAVLLVIAAGGGLGYLAYLLVFAN